MTADDSLTKRIRATFGDVSKTELAKKLDGPDWESIRRIEKQYDAQIAFENKTFKLEYHTRFEIARKRLIDKAGRKDRNFVNRVFAGDRFDREAINRQADREVRHAHQRVIDHLKAEKAQTIEAVEAKSDYRRVLREKPKKDFANAANRRSGQDRRRGPSR